MNKTKTEYVESLLVKLYSNQSNIKSVNDITELLGHKLYDKWHDEVLDADILLGVTGGNTISLIYINIEPSIEEYGIYAKNSAKVSMIKDVSSMIGNNSNPDVVKQCISMVYDMQAEGAVGLRQFIKDMRNAHDFPEQVDYNGDKYFIPLVLTGSVNTDNKECECKCANNNNDNKDE